jgi:UDP-glucose 4-epimerase
MADTLVFGGTGFVGEYVCKELSGKSVVSIDSSTREEDRDAFINNATRILWLVRPVEGLLENLSAQLASAPKLQRFVFVSSMLAYPESDAPLDEATSLKPLNDYERAKAEEEKIVQRIFSREPEKLVIARMANVYGDVKNTGVVGKIFSALRDGGVFTVYGDGSQRRDYIHVEDVARLLATLLFEKDVRGVYNVSTGVPYALTDVIAHVERITGKKLQLAHGPSTGEKHSVVGKNDKILRLPGISIRETLDTGLRKTYNHYQ